MGKFSPFQEIELIETNNSFFQNPHSIFFKAIFGEMNNCLTITIIEIFMKVEIVIFISNTYNDSSVTTSQLIDNFYL